MCVCVYGAYGYLHAHKTHVPLRQIFISTINLMTTKQQQQTHGKKRMRRSNGKRMLFAGEEEKKVFVMYSRQMHSNTQTCKIVSRIMEALAFVNIVCFFHRHRRRSSLCVCVEKEWMNERVAKWLLSCRYFSLAKRYNIIIIIVRICERCERVQR